MRRWSRRPRCTMPVPRLGPLALWRLPPDGFDGQGGLRLGFLWRQLVRRRLLRVWLLHFRGRWGVFQTVLMKTPKESSADLRRIWLLFRRFFVHRVTAPSRVVA